MKSIALPPRTGATQRPTSAGRVPSAAMPGTSVLSPRRAKAMMTSPRQPSPTNNNNHSHTKVTSPRRPMSASRVHTGPSATAAAISPRVRPASARPRTTTPRATEDDDDQLDLDTISLHVQRLDVRIPTAPANSVPVEPRKPKATIVPDALALAKLRAFLEAWEQEQPTFRSSVLFSESTFAQAKSMVEDWPHPNAFLASIAFGCMEQFAQLFKRQYPFFEQLVQEIGGAIYANYEQLQNDSREAERLGAVPRNRFLYLFEHGQHWFDQAATEKQRHQELQCQSNAARDELERLQAVVAHSEPVNERNGDNDDEDEDEEDRRVSKHSEARKTKKQPQTPPQQRLKKTKTPTTTKTEPDGTRAIFPELRKLLYCSADDQVRFDWKDTLPDDYDFALSIQELVVLMASYPPKEAARLVARILEKAIELELPKLPETLAVAVDMMDEKYRRRFLGEYLLYIDSTELQDALRERDETNEEKQWLAYLDDMKEALHLTQAGPTVIGATTTHAATFHSDAAQVMGKIFELMELVEDVAAELSLGDPKYPALPLELVRRLTPYQNSIKRVEKARQLMMTRQNSTVTAASATPFVPAACGCICGRHKLLLDSEYDQLVQRGRRIHGEIEGDSDGDNSADETVRKKSKAGQRKSTIKRPSSAKRKNAMNFGSRFSLKGNRLFPLSEVCHLLSAILHLKFSRDSTDGSDTQPLLDRWDFLRRKTKLLSFKTLAKDYLVRKYGIKSIAVMHTMQLERSLVHYSAMERHVRCELFAWFFGADKLRVMSKDYAFAFFQRLIKCVIAVFVKKSNIKTLPFATVLAVWSEYIGDGETNSSRVHGDASNSGSLIRFLTPMHAVDACNMAFPTRMKEENTYKAFAERIYRAGFEKDQIEMEAFLKKTMEVWHIVFQGMITEIDANWATALQFQAQARGPEEDGPGDSVAASDVIVIGSGRRRTGVALEDTGLDLHGFTECLRLSDLSDLTSGERLELFDLLTQEEDENVVGKKRMTYFLLETKYLK